MGRLGAVEHAVGGAPDQQRRRGNSGSESPRNAAVLCPAQTFGDSCGRRGREVGGLLARVGEGLLRRAVLLRTAVASRPESSHGPDSFVLGRNAHRVVAERAGTGGKSP